MDNLLLHPQSERRITALLRQPPHAIIISGPAGSGKTLLARTIAAALLGIAPEKLEFYAYAREYQPEKGIISVEQARDMTGFLRLKTTGTNALRRILLVEHADTMTVEAQNTLLKTLEEPPADTVIILTVDDIQAILQTVLSRAQRVDVQSPTELDAKEYFLQKGYSDSKAAQAYALSGGLPGLMQALLDGDETHPLVASVEQAKQLLGVSSFERLAQVDTLIKQKQHQAVVWAIMRIASAAIAGAAAKGSDTAIARWSAILAAAARADEQLRASAQAKLVMTNLFLAL